MPILKETGLSSSSNVKSTATFYIKLHNRLAIGTWQYTLHHHFYQDKKTAGTIFLIVPEQHLQTVLGGMQD